MTIEISLDYKIHFIFRIYKGTESPKHKLWALKQQQLLRIQLGNGAANQTPTKYQNSTMRNVNNNNETENDNNNNNNNANCNDEIKVKLIQ